MNSDLTADRDWMGWRAVRCQVTDKFPFSLEIRVYIGHDPHYFLTGVGFGGDNDRRSNIILSILTPFGYTLKTPITARTAGRSDRTERRT